VCQHGPAIHMLNFPAQIHALANRPRAERQRERISISRSHRRVFSSPLSPEAYEITLLCLDAAPTSRIVWVFMRPVLYQRRYSDWLRAGRQRGRSSIAGKIKNFLSSTSFRPALGSTEPPLQWVPGALSSGVKRPGREAGDSPPPRA
jgi:hypothetical protein